jgi:serine/threonine protein phosphatase PrpC
VQFENADLNLLGHRQENQDRSLMVSVDDAVLIAVVDGMGGHAHGALAAETAVEAMREAFLVERHPLFDPEGFLHLTIGRAHDAVVQLGTGLPMEMRPRATCALCLVQDGHAFVAHVGDSRVYLLRGGEVAERTRDHSHVELLLQSGKITEAQAMAHPMRNYVECCIGGDPVLPEMTIGARRSLQPGDVLLLCTDGFWSGVSDAQIAALAHAERGSLGGALEELAVRAVRSNAPFADNTTVTALRWYGP